MLELEIGKMYNVRDIIKDYMPCNIKIGSYYAWKKYNYEHLLSNKVDDGLRYLLQPLLNNMYRVHNIYSIKEIKKNE